MRAVRGEGGEKEWLRCVNRRSHPGHRHSLLTLSSPLCLARTSICFDPACCPSGLRGDVKIPPNIQGFMGFKNPPCLCLTSICFDPACCHSILYIGLREMSKSHPIYRVKGDVKILPNTQG